MCPIKLAMILKHEVIGYWLFVISYNSHLAPCQQQALRPVPQRVNFFVEWASCPFRKG